MDSEEDIKRRLTSEEYSVLREGGTEAPFSGALNKNYETGVYTCKVCGLELFTSAEKFDSGTGWPSFSNPAIKKNIIVREDASHGMVRTEVLCAQCKSHLGHVFDDGPKEKGSLPALSARLPARRAQASKHAQAGGRQGKRYCINSICLNFKKAVDRE